MGNWEIADRQLTPDRRLTGPNLAAQIDDRIPGLRNFTSCSVAF
jgi:hypothetical protein